ncbi:TraB/GumN family protein [Thiosocius teredinicola]|uniref:TraB/GumN family protein n=1 Tax=Thiosocius teredinicola TaxID=1973002 RepID=UPI000990F392
MRRLIAIYPHGWRWIGLVLVLVLVWGDVAAQSRGLIFEVSREGAPTSYLVGTMHSEDERILALVPRISTAIEKVDVVALELIPDGLPMLAAGLTLFLPPDQSLREIVGDCRFRRLATMGEDIGVAPEYLDRLKPWAAAMTLWMPPQESGVVLDMKIYLEALRLEREVFGIETIFEQMALFGGMSREMELSLLDNLIQNADLVPKQLEEMTKAYLDGGLAGLDAVAREQTHEMPPEVEAWFEDDLLAKRNIRMLERVQEMLQQRPMMIAVGALHLSGETGLVKGLQRLGYRVEPW